MENKRLVKYEIVRIIAMLSIVMYHALTHGHNSFLNIEQQLRFSPQNGTVNYIVCEFILSFTSIAVNLYVLITGYFLCLNTKYKFTKILKIWLQLFFYSIIITSCLGECTLQTFFPIKNNTYWFATIYVGLLALAPFISRLINILNKRDYIILLVILFFMQIDLYHFPYGFLYGDGWGGKVLLFITLYLTGGYIRKYSLGKLDNTRYSKISFLLVFILVTSYYFFISYYNNTLFTLGASPIHSFSYIIAILFFIVVKNMNLKETKVILLLAKIAPYTFGVYLIHDHPLVRNILWHNIIIQKDFCNEWYYIPALIIIVFFIFATCTIIDFLRNKIFMILKLEKMSALIIYQLKSFINTILKHK